MHTIEFAMELIGGFDDESALPDVRVPVSRRCSCVFYIA
jgi:hypothetical protein